MEVVEYISALEREGRLLIESARIAGLEAPVPTCPGWRVRELLAHINYVHRWATAYVAGALTEMLPEPAEEEILRSAPRDDELFDSAEEGHAALVRALGDAPPDLNCWTFLPAASPLAMWARRQAHETAVHRVDAELAAGRIPQPLDKRLAVDGVDELLLSMLSRGEPPKEAETGLGAICLEARGLEESWSVRLGESDVRAEAGEAPWDLLIRAGASDLFLLLWNRPSLEKPELRGETGLLDLWRERIRVTW
ncbi:MAG: maleylpyruvate isomerase family mycothiol-dependent enzyme [Actinomycetota bacterium]|nr:maleylpyruvate isomerase family mycothiol-dependent enzyme [Actinomycetota bacterium]